MGGGPPDEIDALLKEAQAAGDDVEAFARVHLETYAGQLRAVVLWQRTEGRARVLAGEEPDVILAEVNAKIAEAREGFRGKLERLLTWARGAGGE